jgi:hypothetical protein
MRTPSSSNDSGHGRRLIVTLVIASAAAAVTAGVSLKKHPSGESVVERAPVSPMLAGNATPARTPAQSRRAEWRDPWKRPAPLSAPSSAPTHDAAADGGPRLDPSLPSAAAAIEGNTGFASEPASTF